MAELLNIDINQFIMRKYGFKGVDIRVLSETIDTMTMSNMNIYLEFGTPANECKNIY